METDESVSEESQPPEIHTFRRRDKTKFELEDEDWRAWELVHDVPQLNTTRAYGACAANVLVPGSGTMYAALQSEDQNIRETQALVGLLQLCAACTIVGWSWSIRWGYMIAQKSTF